VTTGSGCAAAQRPVREDAAMALLPALRTSTRRPVAVAASLAAAALAMAGLGGCGDSDESPSSAGPRAQAVEKLVDYGLAEPDAACVADELGAEVVVEATDLNALAEGQPYRDAADRCLADG
jgi:hypothetical protein